jgi:hypothetical protein
VVVYPLNFLKLTKIQAFSSKSHLSPFYTFRKKISISLTFTPFFYDKIDYSPCFYYNDLSLEISPLLTLVTLSLYFISPSRNKYRPWLMTQPFIGAHKSNIWLYCFISFSKLSLLESCETWKWRNFVDSVTFYASEKKLNFYFETHHNIITLDPRHDTF